MAQGGDPNGNGSGGSGVNIPAEFSDEPHVRGTVSMARSSSPDSASSQFFIVFARLEMVGRVNTRSGVRLLKACNLSAN